MNAIDVHWEISGEMFCLLAGNKKGMYLTLSGCCLVRHGCSARLPIGV